MEKFPACLAFAIVVADREESAGIITALCQITAW